MSFYGFKKKIVSKLQVQIMFVLCKCRLDVIETKDGTIFLKMKMMFHHLYDMSEIDDEYYQITSCSALSKEVNKFNIIAVLFVLKLKKNHQ